uniref:Uncharacterized protein n=1 Tax=Anguilla anguilla TaxID=7936 RepID=A0A0E9SSI3_ANGAN
MSYEIGQLPHQSISPFAFVDHHSPHFSLFCGIYLWNFQLSYLSSREPKFDYHQ